MGKEVCISEPSHDGREEEGNDGHGGDAGVMRGNWRRKQNRINICRHIRTLFASIYLYGQ